MTKFSALKSQISNILIALAVGLMWGSLVWAAEHPVIPAAAIRCETRARFSPDGQIAEELVKGIESAREKIRIALYGINNPKLVDALIAARKEGVDIAIKLDRLQSSLRRQKEAIGRLKKGGVKVEVSQLSRLLHDKFMVVDGRRIWTGSYNWTIQAESHHRENIVSLECPELAVIYEQEWEMIEIH